MSTYNAGSNFHRTQHCLVTDALINLTRPFGDSAVPIPMQLSKPLIVAAQVQNRECAQVLVGKYGDVVRRLRSQLHVYTDTYQVPIMCTVISCVSTLGQFKFTGKKTGVGVYTEKPFVRITHIHMYNGP